MVLCDVVCLKKKISQNGSVLCIQKENTKNGSMFSVLERLQQSLFIVYLFLLGITLLPRIRVHVPLIGKSKISKNVYLA